MKAVWVQVMFCMIAICAQAQRQGIEGRVEWLSGNQMPGPERKVTPAKGVKREIWIYEPVSTQQADSDGVFYTNIRARLVRKVKSKSNGNFRVNLPPGEYSLFVKETRGLFANQFDGQGRINCVLVKSAQFSRISIIVDYKAAY